MARPTNALIVDDEPHVRAFMRLLLRELGITSCWEAADGVSALQMLEEHQPELMLLDINLPVLGGLQALAEMREAGYTTPVVMITSQSAVTTVNEAVRLGAIGYLLKHCPKDEALKILREALESVENDEPEGAS